MINERPTDSLDDASCQVRASKPVHTESHSRLLALTSTMILSLSTPCREPFMIIGVNCCHINIGVLNRNSTFLETKGQPLAADRVTCFSSERA
jgi:hypothetical protein